jgi:hypothetical protein
MFPLRTARNLVVAASLVCAAGARADNAPAAPANPNPSPAAVAAASDILGAIGIKERVALVVPAMMTELEQNVTRTRPEIKDSLRQTLQAIKPEFDKTAIDVFNQAAALLASQLSEKEVVEVASFYDSPTGKKFVAIEPAFLQKLSTIADPWRQKLSTDIVTRARQEMKNKGVDF